VWEALENNKAMVSLFKPHLSIQGMAKVKKTNDDDDDNDDELKDKEGSMCYWDSDEDNFIDLGDKKFASYPDGIVGLHPHKDVVFLETSDGIFAYHFRTLRMQYLGSYLVRNSYQHAHGIDAGFPYRPCYVDALPTTKLPYRGW
jgi:hypothetical protein